MPPFQRKPRYEIKSGSDQSLHLESSVVVEDQNPMANTSKLSIYLRIKSYQGKLPEVYALKGTLKMGSRSSTDSGWLIDTLWQKNPSNTPSKELLWSGSRTVNHDTFGFGPLQLKAEVTGLTPGRSDDPNIFSLGFSEILTLPLLPRGPAVVPREYSKKWVMSQAYVKVDGIWRKAIPYRKVGASWVLCSAEGADQPEGIKYGPMK